MLRTLVALALTLYGCPTTKSSGITGNWKGWVVFEGKLGPQYRYSPRWDIELKRDGTFTLHMENHVMIDIVEDGKGAYRVQDNVIALKGSATTRVDDGYKKEQHKRAINEKLTLRHEQLWMTVDPSMVVLFSRPGSQPYIPRPSKPLTKLK